MVAQVLADVRGAEKLYAGVIQPLSAAIAVCSEEHEGGREGEDDSSSSEHRLWRFKHLLERDAGEH